MKIEDLFKRFPRDVDYPRKVVYNYEELKRFVELTNGIKSVYVALYDHTFIIDKIFFDFDSKDITLAFEDVKTFIKRLNEYNYPFIPVFSGRKGFHVYVLLKPWTPPNVETAKAVLRDLQQALAGDLTTCDRNIFGDIRRLTRYPNTLNKTNYCVPLPYDFVNWNISQIIDYAKSQREIDYEIKNLPSINAFIDNINEYTNAPSKLKPLHEIVDMPPLLYLVKPLIRPCIFESVTIEPDPPHIVRLSLVTELMYYGWSKESIHELIKKLKWRDYNSKMTKLQIDQIFRKKYLPPSCYKIKNFVRCNECGWVYYYNWNNT